MAALALNSLWLITALPRSSNWSLDPVLYTGPVGAMSSAKCELTTVIGNWRGILIRADQNHRAAAINAKIAEAISKQMII
jgi:hypothetical protein